MNQNILHGRGLSTNAVYTAAASAWRNAWTMSTFLSFCWISYILAVAIGGAVFYLIIPRVHEMDLWLGGGQSVLFYGAIIFFFLFFGILGVGLMLITLTALTGVDLLYPHGGRSVTVKVLFPIAASLSQIVRVDRNRLRTSFVKVNNALTLAQRKRIRGDRILILLPHCLQIDVCNRKITTDIHNCVRCGRCPVGQLLEFESKYQLTFAVVNGGTLAKRKVVDFKPTGIIAVACERDLTLGIQEVYPIPVYGVINDRPHGPCVNTCVDMSLLEEAILFFKENREKNAGIKEGV